MDKTVDLVCGMEVDPQDAKFQSEHHEHSFYFCSLECKSRFDARPSVFIQNRAEAKISA